MRLVIVEAGVSLKIECINDVPVRVGSARAHPLLGRLDSPENILANKITALIDREEPKDFADIWGFCCQMRLSLLDAITGAQGKAARVGEAMGSDKKLEIGESVAWRGVNCWAGRRKRHCYILCFRQSKEVHNVLGRRQRCIP